MACPAEVSPPALFKETDVEQQVRLAFEGFGRVRAQSPFRHLEDGLHRLPVHKNRNTQKPPRSIPIGPACNRIEFAVAEMPAAVIGFREPVVRHLGRTNDLGRIDTVATIGPDLDLPIEILGRTDAVLYALGFNAEETGFG